MEKEKTTFENEIKNVIIDLIFRTGPKTTEEIFEHFMLSKFYLFRKIRYAEEFILKSLTDFILNDILIYTNSNLLKLSESEVYSLIRSNNGRAFHKDVLIENFQGEALISPAKSILDNLRAHIEENVDNIDKHNSYDVIERWQEDIPKIRRKIRKNKIEYVCAKVPFITNDVCGK